MAAYKVSEEGKADIAKIYEYGIETFGLQQAQDYSMQLHDIFEKLAQNDSLGRDASEYKPFLKRFNFKEHSIFYMATDTHVFIVRILGQKQDLGRHL